MKNKQLTLGSLFSGSGGFELAGTLAGVKPIWNSEVEPFPIAVTCKRFPNVKHYGDVSALSGAELEPVDIITWGSPCQGLSVAGKRKGLKDERSGLYVEAVRIVKEMLEATGGEYPKFCVFENVQGLLSSADGEDFITCLDMIQELGFLPDANILDAQFMGVPQRRKRVYITWVQVDYILQKRTPLSDSIMLQLLTEILQINLVGLLVAYGIELKKSASKSMYAGTGLKRRINLFSLQKEDRLQMLQQRLEDIKAMFSNVQSGLVFNPGADLMAETISTVGDMKLGDSTTESQSWSIGQLLKSALEDGLQIESGFITSIWTKETIAQKICTCFQALLNILDVTISLMRLLEKEPMSLNCFEWVQYILTEMKEFIDETKKYERCAGQVAWHDDLRSFEQELQAREEPIERCFTEVCGCEVLPKSEGLSGYTPQSQRSWEGTSGNLTQSIRETSVRRGSEQLILEDQGGSMIDVGINITSTLRTETHGHPLCVMETKDTPQQTVFGIGSYKSNAMLSDNPHSGIYEAETARTLDIAGGNPSCNQGGMCVVEKELMAFTQNQRNEVRDLGDKSGALQAEPGMKQQTYVLQGNMIGRNDKNGPQGCGISEDVCYTLTDVDRHAVVAPEDSVYAMTAGFFMEVSEEKAPTLKARDYKDPTTVAPVSNSETKYTVRRLTPTECARLQGFPDWWCHDLGNPNPTDEELKFWMDVWETHRKVVSHTAKPKSEKQVRKWLVDPYSDSAEYKLWGNGIQLNCAFFVLSGVVWAATKE